MKKSFGLARKVMRIGKFVEHFKAAAVAMDAKGMDPVLRYAAVGRQLGYAGYLTLDNISAVSTPPAGLQDGEKETSQVGLESAAFESRTSRLLTFLSLM